MLTRLGKFEILRLLAQGSMGEIYLGRDPMLGREVAIKVIRPSARMGAEARERFATEARASAVLNHPNIVTIHEMGEEDGVLYLAMELVKGEDLGTLIRAGTLAPRDALEVVAQVCDGLAVAHRHQVLHRDIKPSNIRVVWDGKQLQVKVLDFGVAKVLSSDITDEGTIFGTVNYMAPEYLQSGRPDSRSDLFAVGVLLYESLAGVPPFDGLTPGTVIYRLLHEHPTSLPPKAFKGISRDAQTVVTHALAKDPDMRFQTAEELAAVLRSAKDPAWKWSLPHAASPSSHGPASPSNPSVAQAVRSPAPPIARSVPPGKPQIPPSNPQDVPAKPPPLRASSPIRLATSPAQLPGVDRDLLETTRHQLSQALKHDPGNAKVHAMLLVTQYRLGKLEEMMQTLRQARSRGISADLMKQEPRCHQVVEEERTARLLPLEWRKEFMGFLGN